MKRFAELRSAAQVGIPAPTFLRSVHTVVPVYLRRKDGTVAGLPVRLLLKVLITAGCL
jgi:hypothetical protein